MWPFWWSYYGRGLGGSPPNPPGHGPKWGPGFWLARTETVTRSSCLSLPHPTNARRLSTCIDMMGPGTNADREPVVASNCADWRCTGPDSSTPAIVVRIASPVPCLVVRCELTAGHGAQDRVRPAVGSCGHFRIGNTVLQTVARQADLGGGVGPGGWWHDNSPFPLQQAKRSVHQGYGPALQGWWPTNHTGTWKDRGHYPIAPRSVAG